MKEVIRQIVDWFRTDRAAGSSGDDEPGINYKGLESVIGYKIKNREIFSEALAHRSYAYEPTDGKKVSYERLEFLGDSILNMVVAEHLYLHYSTHEEGELTKLRSRLVNRKTLSILSKQMRLQDYVLLGTSIPRSTDRGLDKILADTFEALVAAIYLDDGFEAAQEFVNRQIQKALQEKTIAIDDVNFKSRLLEYSQAEDLPIPRYTTIKEEGPDHDRLFTVEVFLGEESYGSGNGKSKKDAEQAAAEKALQKLGII